MVVAGTVLLGQALFAQSTTNIALAWDPSPDATVVGYRVYYGKASGSYDESITLGNVTTTTVPGLLKNVAYYFVATAFNGEMIESEFSNEAVYLPPPEVINHPPTLDQIAPVSFRENVPGNIVQLEGVTCGDGGTQTVTVTAESSNPEVVGNPDVMKSSGPNWCLVFPAAKRGMATITVTVSDGQAVNSTVRRSFEVNVTGAVNLPPTMDPLPDLTIAENSGEQTVMITGISAGTGESQPIEVNAVCSNPLLISNPEITYSSPNSTAILKFRPVPYAHGSVTFQVSVYDGQTRDNITRRSFVVNIMPVNQPPTLDPIQNITISRDAGETRVPMTGISSGQGSEAQTLVITAVSSNPDLCPSPQISYSPGATQGTLIFPALSSGPGSAVVTVTVNDGSPTNSTVARSFNVTVMGGNRPPTIDSIADVNLMEDSAAVSRSIRLTGISSGSASENQTITVSAKSSDPALVPDPSVSYTSPNNTASLMFTQLPYASGVCTIQITVNDGQGANSTTIRSFTINIAAVNQPPTLDAIENVFAEENATQQSVPLTGIGTGAPNENQSLSVSASSSNPSLIPDPFVQYASRSATGTLFFQPCPGQFGSATLTVIVTDDGETNNVVSRSFTVTVGAANRPPTLDPVADVTIEENAPLQVVRLTGISAGAASETNQFVSLAAFSSDPAVVSEVTVNYTNSAREGTVSFRPGRNMFGNATITVLVNDGQKANADMARSFKVNVTPVNRPPTLDVISDVVIDENSGLQVIPLAGMSAGASHEQQNLTVAAVSSDASLVPKPIVNYASPNSSGWLSFTPMPFAFGVCTITVTVTDGQPTNSITTRSFTVTVKAVNQPPTLNQIADLMLDENGPERTVSLSGISCGATNENQRLSVLAQSSDTSLIPNPSVAYSSPSSTGQLSLRPVPGKFGSATITVTVDDGGDRDNTVSRAFMVTVGATNRPPTLDPIADLAVQENAGPHTVSLTGIGSGATHEVQALAISAKSSNPGLLPDPIVTYTSPGPSGKLLLNPAAGQSGSAIVTVTVNDGATTANMISRAFKVTVSAFNRPPTLAVIDNMSVDEGAGLQVVPLNGISAGAAGENQTVVVTAISSDRSLIPDPKVNYTSPGPGGFLTFEPATYASGSCTITVTLNDGQSINNLFARSFLVTVRPVNQAPTLAAIRDLKVAEDSEELEVLLTGISSGAPNEHQTLTAVASSGNPALIPTPDVSYSSPSSTGMLKLRPTPGMSGTALITVTIIEDGDYESIARRTFTVTVEHANRPPTLDAIPNLSLLENAGAHTITLTGISPGADGESQPLSISVESSDPLLVPAPVVSYVSGAAEAMLTITPKPGKHGSAAITVLLQDGQAQNGSCSRTFQVKVNPINRRPTLEAVADITLQENAEEFIVAVSGISSGAEFERQTLTVTAVSSDPDLILSPRVIYSSPNATASLVLVPRPFAFGSCLITVSVNDGQETNNIATHSFLATVLPVNQPPTLDHIPDVAIVENAPAQTIALTGIGSGMSNEVQELRVTASSSDPGLIPNPDVIYDSPASVGTLTFKAVPGTFGSATISVVVNDGAELNSIITQMFTVTVGAVNRRPTLDPIANVDLAENASRVVRLTGISTGASFEKQSLAFSASSSNPALIPTPVVTYSPPGTEASLSIVPAADQFGSATITVTLDDGQADSSTISRAFTVKVTPVNRPPTLDPLNAIVIDEDAGPVELPLSGISSGASHESQLVTLRATSSNPMVIPDPVITHVGNDSVGMLILTPVADASGTAEITVTVDDGQAANNQIARSMEVTVRPKNDPPTLDPISPMSISENSPVRNITLTGLSAGPGENEILSITATSSDPALIPPPTVQYDGHSTNATLTFKPVPGESGRATIIVTVDDGQDQFSKASRSFLVDVLPVNRPPTIDPMPDVVVQENSGPLSLQLSGISSGRASEQQRLVVAAVSSNPSLLPAPEVSHASPNSHGTLVLRPAADSSGTATITVIVDDGMSTANIASTSFKVTVLAQNRPPTLDPINNVVMSGDSSTEMVPLTGISCGPATEKQPVTIVAVSSNPSLVPHPRVEYTSGSEGKLILEPARNASGSVVISVSADDGQSSANLITRTFIVSLPEINQPPTLDPIADITIHENSPQTIPLTGISSGAPNEDQTLLITAISSDPKLLVPSITYSSPSSRGELSFIPTPYAAGTAVVSVIVSDSSSGVLTRSFRVTILDINLSPTLDAIDSHSIEENSGPQFIHLTGISSGAPNEDQVLTVKAFSSNPGLIPAPSVIYTNPSSTAVLSFNTVPNKAGECMITVQVNDGGSSNNVVSRNFRVTVASVNQKPTLNPLANLTLNENAGPQNIMLKGISSGAPDEVQSISVLAFSSRPDIIPHPVVSYSSPNNFATLSFTPVPYANGTAAITVTVDDGQLDNAVTTRTFNIIVNAVNQAPTIDPIGPLFLPKNAPVQTIPLTGISCGAANELQTLTVTAASSNTKVVATPTVSYLSPQSTGVLHFTIPGNAIGSATVTVTVRDGDQQNGVATCSFVVNVGMGDGRTSTNAPPTLDPVSNITIRENAGTQLVRLAGIAAGYSHPNQRLIVTAVSSSPAIIPHPVVEYHYPSTTGTLTFAPATDAFGSAMITITVDDEDPGNEVTSRKFMVSITPVNNPPTLDEVPNCSVPLNSGQRVINLSGITPGPANEFQMLTVTARSSNPSVVPSPVVNYRSGNRTGTLTISPLNNAIGKAVITVTVSDGQTENSTFERSFEFEVVGENAQPTLDPISDIRVPLDSHSQTVALSGISSGNSFENQPLAVTAESSDPKLIAHPKVSYTSPDTVGTLTVEPVQGRAGSATITVRVDDGASTTSSISRSFVVTIMAASAGMELGSAVVPAGDTNSVPLTVATEFGSTNLSFSISLPRASLTNLMLQQLAPEADPASAKVIWQTATNAQLRLSARTGKVFTSDHAVARLGFRAVGPRTVRVPLTIENAAVTLSCGSSVAARVTGGGEVLVLGDEPLLQAGISADGGRKLTIFGKAGSSYAIEYATNTDPGAVWMPLNIRFGLTNSSFTVDLPAQTGPRTFYRAVEFRACPPQLEPAPSNGADCALMLYGEPGATYEVQRSGALAQDGSGWAAVATVTLSNSFRRIEVPRAGPVSLFRLLKR